MTFKQEHIPDFLQIFEASKPKIEAFEGCSQVDLYQDKTDDRVLMTHSIWESADALEKYRKSALFEQTWARTKVLFDAKPEAWSVEKIM